LYPKNKQDLFSKGFITAVATQHKIIRELMKKVQFIKITSKIRNGCKVGKTSDTDCSILFLNDDQKL
jgi:hypothetical protein